MLFRSVLTSALGYLFAVPIPRKLGIDAHWGGAGLTISFGIAGWVEFVLLKRALVRRIGNTGVPLSLSARLWAAATVAAAAAFGLKQVLSIPSNVLTAALVLGAFGAVYLAATIALKVSEATVLLRWLKFAR